MIALSARTFRDSRGRTIAFPCLFGFYAYIQPVAFRSSYGIAESRVRFAQAFGPNTAIRIFYGAPRDLLNYLPRNNSVAG